MYITLSNFEQGNGQFGPILHPISPDILVSLYHPMSSNIGTIYDILFIMHVAMRVQDLEFRCSLYHYIGAIYTTITRAWKT